MKEIDQTAPVDATVEVPGSKSVTNRALLLAMAAPGESEVVRPLDCDDSRYMLQAIRKIGFPVEGSLKDAVTIGERVSMYSEEVELFVGNAGTAMRFLCGMLPFVPGRYLLNGDSRMQERPIGDLVEALAQLDAEIEFPEKEGFPPVSIRGRLMRGGGRVSVDGSVSSQFVSALMMGGATLPQGLRVEITDAVSRPYIAMTEAILRQFGVTVEKDATSVGVRGPLEPARVVVEPDFSSASYWMAAALVTGGKVRLRGMAGESVQGDAGFVRLLDSIGAGVRVEDDVLVIFGAGELQGGTFDLSDMPDMAPTLAVVAPFCSEPVEIINVANLRVKESDRLEVLGSELTKLGVRVEVGHDSIRIEPGMGKSEAVIDPHGDHRIAMAFAVLGLGRGNVKISDPGVVAKSYPGFWRTLDEVAAATNHR